MRYRWLMWGWYIFFPGTTLPCTVEKIRDTPAVVLQDIREAGRYVKEQTDHILPAVLQEIQDHMDDGVFVGQAVQNWLGTFHDEIDQAALRHPLCLLKEEVSETSPFDRARHPRVRAAHVQRVVAYLAGQAVAACQAKRPVRWLTIGWCNSFHDMVTAVTFLQQHPHASLELHTIDPKYVDVRALRGPRDGGPYEVPSGRTALMSTLRGGENFQDIRNFLRDICYAAERDRELQMLQTYMDQAFSGRFKLFAHDNTGYYVQRLQDTISHYIVDVISSIDIYTDANDFRRIDDYTTLCAAAQQACMGCRNVTSNRLNFFGNPMPSSRLVSISLFKPALLECGDTEANNKEKQYKDPCTAIHIVLDDDHPIRAFFIEENIE